MDSGYCFYCDTCVIGVIGREGYWKISINSSMSRVASLSAEESAKDHELLIHTLTHEHSVGNITRHKQVLVQWTKDYAEGFFIRDLKYVIAIFGILRDRLSSNRDLFREVVSAVFKVAALPLLRRQRQMKD